MKREGHNSFCPYNDRSKYLSKTGGFILISTSDFKRGLTIELNGEIYSIVDFQHVKPGKGGAFVQNFQSRRKNGTSHN